MWTLPEHNSYITDIRKFLNKISGENRYRSLLLCQRTNIRLCQAFDMVRVLEEEGAGAYLIAQVVQIIFGDELVCIEEDLVAPQIRPCLQGSLAFTWLVVVDWVRHRLTETYR